MKVACSIKSH